MNKTLLLFIQSYNPGTYVNVLMHCLRDMGIRQVYFVGSEEIIGMRFELAEFIESIKEEAETLSNGHREYVVITEFFQNLGNIESHIFRVSLTSPDKIIPDLKKRFDVNNLIVDITGCSKQLAGDILISYLVNGVKHVCYFQLSRKVFTQEWKASKMYHELKRGGIIYYEYDDFSNHMSILAALDSLNSMVSTNDEYHLNMENAVEQLVLIKDSMDENANKHVQRTLKLFVGILFVIWVVIIVLTLQFGWDTIEPWTFIFGFLVTIISYAYFAFTYQEFSPMRIYKHVIESRKQKNFEEYGFDLNKYEELKAFVTRNSDKQV